MANSWNHVSKLIWILVWPVSCFLMPLMFLTILSNSFASSVLARRRIFFLMYISATNWKCSCIGWITAVNVEIVTFLKSYEIKWPFSQVIRFSLSTQNLRYVACVHTSSMKFSPRSSLMDQKVNLATYLIF